MHKLANLIPRPSPSFLSLAVRVKRVEQATGSWVRAWERGYKPADAVALVDGLHVCVYFCITVCGFLGKSSQLNNKIKRGSHKVPGESRTRWVELWA